jgi:flagella basal body P-ring formation protein FlgA
MNLMIRPLIALSALLMAGTAFAAPAKVERISVPVAALSSEPVSTASVAPRRLQLRAELTLTRDFVTYGDLFAGAPADLASAPAFRAPALGETGTIQVGRIVEAARGAGLVRDAADLDTQGLAQVVVTRAARRLTASDLDAAVKTGLQERFGVDARAFALSIDGGAPALAIEPELTGEAVVVDLGYDARSRRVQARLMVPGSTAMRLKPVRISGQLVETVEVVVPRRAIARGETLGKADLIVERRPRDAQTGEFIGDLRAAVDKVARRALFAGMPLRGGDVQREEIVAKGDLVTIVYEAPGLMITMRGRASDAGAMGDVVSVTNPQSKRVLQGTVSGPGRVSVQASSTGRVASAN